MKTPLRFFCALFLLTLSLITHADDSLTAKVDKLFAAWDKPDTPGCALAIIKDGQIIYKRGYGMASLEFDKPIQPSTAFCIASVSKQFTAFAIQLLAQDGKLSLDDDVRKYVPELHDFGKTITIRHLIHHTSGLRDYFGPLNLAGWGGRHDSILQSDILQFLWRQKELNFAPGEKYLYSNSGYVLMGLIIQRVSGKTLREFADERIFQPLGMTQTQFRDDYQAVIKNLSSSYIQRGQEFRTELLAWEGGGEGNIISTVEDMAKWDQNFTDAKIGGPTVIAAMQQKGKLNSGKEITYASGLGIAEYKGLRTVDHGGSVGGYRTEFLRFPDQKLTVILLANADRFAPSALARSIADLYLEEQIKVAAKTAASETTAPAAPTPVPVKVAPERLKAYVGKFAFSSFVRSFQMAGDELQVVSNGTPTPLIPLSETRFSAKGFPTTYTFVRTKQGAVTQVVRESDGDSMVGERYTQQPLTPKQLSASTGTFFNDELDAFCTLFVRDGRLILRGPKFEYPLRVINANFFQWDHPSFMMPIRCLRDRKGRISTLFIDTSDRAQKIRFVRADKKPPLYVTAYRNETGSVSDWADWLPPTDLSALKVQPDSNILRIDALKQYLADIAANKPEIKSVRPELLRALEPGLRAELADLLKEVKTVSLVLEQDVRQRAMMGNGAPISRIHVFRVENAKGTKYLLVSLTADARIADISLREN